MAFVIRAATIGDIPQLQELIELSIRTLSTDFYTQAQIEGSVGFIFGPDTQLIADTTYFVATTADNPHFIIGCGGMYFHKICCFDSRAGSFSWPFKVKQKPLSKHVLKRYLPGWSFRKTLFGSDRAPGRVPARRDPSKEAASIRAIFVRPGFTRKGLGMQIMEHCEQAAIQAGFSKLEMGSTLTGLSLYSRCGYTRTGEEAVSLPNGESLVVVHMNKKV